MRTLRRNKQPMYYSNLIGTAPIYETDEDGNITYEHYEDSDGNIIYYYDDNGNKIPRDTGQTELIYSKPEEFFANIAMSGGEAEAVEYGLSTADYQAVAVASRNAYPLKEGSLIWHTSPIEYEYSGAEVEVDVNGEIVKTTAPKAVSSDYMVLKSSPSINIDRFILKATNK